MQNQKKLTGGRSMVEMLGVLAVIGVLSIGGVMGFRRAMDTHHVNNLMNDVSLLGMAVATRDQTVFNADCHNYEEASFTIPREFATCTATYGSDDLVVLTVTYNDQMPDRVIHMIENRCTQGIYVSTGATQFTVGSHGWDCELAAMERKEGEEQEDPSEWECTTADECGFLAECKNHHCSYCDTNSIGTLSLECCNQLAFITQEYYESAMVEWKDGKCFLTEGNEEWACSAHANIYDEDCLCQTNTVTKYVKTGTNSYMHTPYCCGENETQAACCAAVGGTWCAVNGMCYDENTANKCNNACVPHTLIQSCSCSWNIEIEKPDTHQHVGYYCCDQVNDDYASCCRAAGGSWSGESAWDYTGTCYSEAVKQDGSCINVIGYGYGGGGGEIH